MKSIAVLMIAALVLTGFGVDARGSGVSNDQQINFTYNTYLYWAFIHDYSTGLRESNTPGIINYDYSLAYNSQYTGVHVAYVYIASLGQYASAQALRHIVFLWLI